MIQNLSTPSSTVESYFCPSALLNSCRKNILRAPCLSFFPPYAALDSKNHLDDSYPKLVPEATRCRYVNMADMFRTEWTRLAELLQT